MWQYLSGALMTTIAASPEIRDATLGRLLDVLDRTPVDAVPFAHLYLEQVFPSDIYASMLEHLPALELYTPDNPRKYLRVAVLEGLTHVSSCRYTFSLNDRHLEQLSGAAREIWSGVAAALTAPELKIK